MGSKVRAKAEMVRAREDDGECGRDDYGYGGGFV